MRIVETHKPFAMLPVQCKRVVQPVRPRRCNGNLPHLELYPVLTLLINHQELAIQIQKSVQTRIACGPVAHSP